MYRTENDAKNCVKGDIVLAQDMETGLIFNQAFNAELVQYDTDYQNEQAVSQLFREHLNDVSRIIVQHFNNSTLIEVGCGKGFFLEHLQKLGFKITGLDPTYEGLNPSVINKYFTPELNLHADGVVLRHVLEHIQDPIGFLANIRESNGGGGKIYIEVPCFDWICHHRAWFDIFYEHVNYFRITDFNRMFGKVYDAGHIFCGQYLYVVADLASLREPACGEQCYFEFPGNFLSSVNYFADKLNQKYQESGKVSVIWGGASKGVVFSIFMHRAGAKIDYVVDINPAKQGKYLPATGLRVQQPEELIKKLEKSADIYVMNGNYLNEIKQLTNNRFSYITVDHEIV
jgi:SAM-dependent methyltransferase